MSTSSVRNRREQFKSLGWAKNSNRCGGALNEKEWRKARQLHEEYGLDCATISKRFGVSGETISRGMREGKGK